MVGTPHTTTSPLHKAAANKPCKGTVLLPVLLLLLELEPVLLLAVCMKGEGSGHHFTSHTSLPSCHSSASSLGRPPGI